uniref:Uncharacterized protein n=1 Tax=Panagrolaimus davidi TaxID=227884 RepID=A0A914NYZ5_9BILA
MKDSSASAAEKQMNRGKISWKDGTSKKQYWPFKASIIHYMAKNPSTAKCYLKMAQSCKYFFEAKPIIIVPRMMNDLHDKSITILCPNKYEECVKNEEKCCIKIDLNKLLHKIWITERLDTDVQTYIPLIRTKIYRCEITVFGIFNIEIMFDDFKLMTLFVEKIGMFNVSVKYNDEKVVTLDKIIESVPNLKFMDL